MAKVFPIEVGRTVCIGVANKYRQSVLAPEPVNGTICKIGRKYLYVQCDGYRHPIPFFKDTFEYASDNPYDEYYHLFPSEKEFFEKILYRKYTDAILFAFQGIARKNLSLSALRRIYSILESESIENLTIVDDSERI